MIQKPKLTIKYNEKGNVVSIYESMNKCAKANKIPVTSLYKAIKGNYSIKGFIYKYSNEHISIKTRPSFDIR